MVPLVRAWRRASAYRIGQLPDSDWSDAESERVPGCLRGAHAAGTVRCGATETECHQRQAYVRFFRCKHCHATQHRTKMDRAVRIRLRLSGSVGNAWSFLTRPRGMWEVLVSEAFKGEGDPSGRPTCCSAGVLQSETTIADPFSVPESTLECVVLHALNLESVVMALDSVG
jgi:hypothetical protein